MGGSDFKDRQAEPTAPARTPAPPGLPSRATRRARPTAAEALRESEQRLRAIVDTAVDAIITIDSDSTILVNPPQRKGSSLLAAIDSARTRNRDDQGVS